MLQLFIGQTTSKAKSGSGGEAVVSNETVDERPVS